MTISSNIFVGLQPWIPGTSYGVLGTRVSNAGNAYKLVGTGVAATSGGPLGTGANISDNTCAWAFVAAINFNNLSSWASSIPATLTQPIIGILYNSGSTITTSAGTSFLTLSGHTTSSTNTITLVCATGDSIRDRLQMQQTPLNFSTTIGVSFTLSSSASAISYLNISDSNVTIDGFQFQDPLSTSTATIIGGTGSNITVANCIFDGFAQASAPVIKLGATGRFYNNLLVDRQATGGTGSAIQCVGNTTNITNSTIISINNNTGGNAIAVGANTGCVARNCNIFNYTTPFSGTGKVTSDFNCLSNSSEGTAAITTLHVLENNQLAGIPLNTQILGYFNHTVYQQDILNNWYLWSGSSWVATTDPR